MEEHILGTKHLMLDGSKVTISQHAIDRYAERFNADEESMRDQLSRALLYGAQRGTDGIFVEGTAAFVVDRHGVVKTTLTKSMLTANMEVTFPGLAVHSEPVNVETPTEVDLLIESLAAQHLSSFPYCFQQQRRKARGRQLRCQLRKLGISPQIEHEKKYRESFLKGYQERIAQNL